MKTTKIVYWILTGLTAALLGIGSVFDAIGAREAVDHVTHLGYPAYLVPFLGIAKLLGILAILAPGFRRLKEWAYAGLVFDLVGAIYSHLSVNDGMGLPLFIPLLLVAGSYIYYHKLTDTTATPSQQRTSLAGAL